MKKIWIPLLCLGLLTGCEQNTTQEETIKKDQTAIENVEAETHQALQLSENGRWQVNEEMIPFIAEGEKLIQDFVEQQNSDFEQLAQQLEDINNKLITSCTMTGESHDQLHNWLHPHLKLVADLKINPTKETAQRVMEQLNLSYEEYHKFFE